MKLRWATPLEWTGQVLENFDHFLVDHAACERKASAAGLSLIQKYPDRREIIPQLVAFAQEELEHFAQVMDILLKRGLQPSADEKDPYVLMLTQLLRHGRDDRLLDRLLLNAVVEARGHERFGLIADALEEGEMKAFYRDITRSEARHHGLFVGLARKYFEEAVIQKRLSDFLEAEAEIVAGMPWRAAVH